MTRRRGRPPHEDVLTPGEWRVADAVRHGMGNAQIARRRGISGDAVKYHLANILAKLGLADRAALRGFAGVARHSALARQETSMREPVRLAALGQIARPVADIKAAEAFFRDVVGLAHLFTFGELAFFDMDGVRLMLTASPGEHTGASVLYFRVDDIRAAHDALAARGAEFVSAPHMIHKHGDGTEEWMAFFNDNEGRPLGIMSQVKG